MKPKNNIELLAKVVDILSELYHNSDLDAKQKGYLETLVGAGIWYLPNNKRTLFSGKISKNALELIKNNSDVKLVEEHFYPRKVSGAMLFNNHLDELRLDYSMLEKLFFEKIGKYNLVLKEENDNLKKFQKSSVFSSPEEAYNLAGIELLDIQQEDFLFTKLKKYNPEGKRKNKISQHDSNSTSLSVGINTSKRYINFLKFLIDNYHIELESNSLFRKVFSKDPNDERFGSSTKYKNKIKEYKGWFYNVHTTTSQKEKRIKEISEFLNISFNY